MFSFLLRIFQDCTLGGIISPILANIYLDKLDKFMEKLQAEFNCGERRKRHKETYELEKKRGVLAKNLRKATNETEKSVLLEKIRELDKKKGDYPSSDPFDSDFKRLQYTRYADDFIVGIIGSKADAETVKEKIKEFTANNCVLNYPKKKRSSHTAQKEQDFSDTTLLFAGLRHSPETRTEAKKRPEFLKMIRLCRQRKIDIILTKSLSRFARNTVDSLKYIRELRELGIAVISEKEGHHCGTI